MLREVARVLADEAQKRVIIVDTSNEIAGDGDIPHPGIGRARRMQVATPMSQHAVMIEAVENHMPEVIVIDEIGTELEAQAARTIAERGVQLVGTAHGNTLENLMQNPTLSDLIGGIQTVTLGDEEARRRGTQKSVLERKAPPTFDVVVEIQDWHNVTVHADVATTVDAILLNRSVTVQVRTRDSEGRVQIAEEAPPRMLPGSGRANGNGGVSAPDGTLPRRSSTPGPRRHTVEIVSNGRWYVGSGKRRIAPVPSVDGATARAVQQASLPPLRIYPFGVSRVKLEEVAREMHLPVVDRARSPGCRPGDDPQELLSQEASTTARCRGRGGAPLCPQEQHRAADGGMPAGRLQYQWTAGRQSGPDGT